MFSLDDEKMMHEDHEGKIEKKDNKVSEKKDQEEYFSEINNPEKDDNTSGSAEEKPSDEHEDEEYFSEIKRPKEEDEDHSHLGLDEDEDEFY